MRVGILTTQTPHHAYFVRALERQFGDVTAFCETSVRAPAYETHHPFEEERDAYEWERWFAGRPTSIEDVAPTYRFASMNDADALAVLRDQRLDVVVVFGTGVLAESLIAMYRDRIFNLHGGDPEAYRGLDTHLWAIFHRDFAGLVTTLHRLERGIDTGDVVLQGKIPLTRGMPLSALRAANTELCVELASSALRTIARDGALSGRQQRQRGRYYSAMPRDLKGVCVSLFAAHVQRLEHDV